MSDAPKIELIETVKFKGHVRDGFNLSAVGVVGKFLVVAGDEDDRLQVLRRDGDHYELVPDREIRLNDTGAEADIEGIACEGNTVFAIGSHAAKRPKLKPTATRTENRAKLEVIEPAPASRSILVRFQLSADGTASDLKRTTLRPLIDSNPLLRPFATVPCKENGVDIEGLAVRAGQLFVGFRGPVLQHGLVPVLTCPFPEAATQAEIVYLALDGRGIRDLEAVRDGFLVLAGPVNDAATGFGLFLWDGRDCTPGGPGEPGRVQFLGPLPTPDGAKAEGLAVETESDHEYRVLVLFDGLKEGGATRFRVRKPN
ncbi:MAG TPA: DUF3616 domain-containing protein [Gemmata sp.]